MLALLAVGALSACTGPQSALDPAGPAAASIARIWWLMLTGAVLVWLLVMACLLWALLRGTNTRALARPQRLIVGGGLALPTCVLIALLVYGTVHSDRITGARAEVDHVIEVTGHQWFWEFRYLDADGHVVATSVDTLAIPLGAMVEFRVTSADVIHSFWIPRLGGKIDAVPGRINPLRLQADRAVPMRGQCAEFCGLRHAHMHFDVQVLDAAQWRAFLTRHAGAPATQARP